MKHLSLEEIIEIYLGNSLLYGMELNISKEIAFQEIQKRAVEYRSENKISELISKLNSALNQLPIIEKTNTITFINNECGIVDYTLFKQLESFCFECFKPHLRVKLIEINDLTNKLDEIWEYDPEHIRYSSKFNDLRTLSQSQEYYSSHNFEDIFFTKTKIWRYQISAILGFDYMESILKQSFKSEITFLPISYKDWNHNRKLVFNFMTSFISMTPLNSYLWILFFTENDDQNGIDILNEDIRQFLLKLQNNSFHLFDLLPITIIERTKNGDLDFRILVKELDEFANKYLA